MQNEQNWLRDYGYQYLSQKDLYIVAIYFSITTITTVGYGDISATCTNERLLSIVIMIVGVISFSFATGSLSSLISNVDSTQAKIRQKVKIIKKLKSEFEISDLLQE